VGTRAPARRVGLDLHDPRLAGLWHELGVGEVGAHHEQRVQVVHQLLRRRGAKQADPAGGVRRVIGDRALPGQGLDDRRTESFRLLSAGAVDCLQLDVTRCGGITEFLRGAALAAAHNVQVSGHCAPNLHAHVAAAVPNLRHLEYFHDHQRIERMFFDGTLDPAGGVLTPDPERAGHRLELRTADAERYREG
jgi:hypothetical protein